MGIRFRSSDTNLRKPPDAGGYNVFKKQLLWRIGIVTGLRLDPDFHKLHLAGVSHKLHHNLTVHGRVLEKGTSGCLSLCHGETPSSDGRWTQDATYGKLKGVKVCHNSCCREGTQVLIVSQVIETFTPVPISSPKHLVRP